MGNLYNIVHGMYPVAPIVLALLGKELRYFGRFRDAWIEKGSDGIRLAVYTRNGGNNRKHFEGTPEDVPEGLECACTGCAITYQIPKHPLYISDVDDSYDNTYAFMYFRFPNAHVVDILMAKLKKAGAPKDAKLEDLAIDPPDMAARWEEALKHLQTHSEK